ncbi:uncharacterized protein [Miscanthus floridulus]|uniref:uncharacterized protein n=1 Tax=Miscanthus floridulus TaxID=154761 RepID=UPI00345A7E44
MTHGVPADRIAMASVGDGGKGGHSNSDGGDAGAKENVTDLFLRLNLTGEEETILDFSDDKGETELPQVEWAVVGKVLSPSIVNVSTIHAAMKPTWGNPHGLKFRVIGAKENNMFMVEFGSKKEMERIMAGTPWMVDMHAVILQPYDERLSVSEIVFNWMEIWARILNVPLGWMIQQRGSRAMSLIGDVVKMDVDGDGKSSGAFLCARMAIDIEKPLRRGVLLRLSRSEEPRWFVVQYEWLPFYCFSCGVLGHSEIECSDPAPRNEIGKLPYDV